MGKIKKISIKENGKDLSTKKQFIKFDKKECCVMLHWNDYNIEFDINDCNGENQKIDEIVFGDKVFKFRYAGEWDEASDSEDEDLKDVENRYEVAFAEQKDFDAFKKSYEKYKESS